MVDCLDFFVIRNSSACLSKVPNFQITRPSLRSNLPKGSRVSSIHDDVAAGIRVHEQTSDGSQLRPLPVAEGDVLARGAAGEAPNLDSRGSSNGGNVSAVGPQAQPQAQPELKIR